MPSWVDDKAGAADSFDALDAAIDEFAAAVRRGSEPSIDSLVARYPEAEQDLRRLLPAILLMERCAVDAARASRAVDSAPTRLGDYEIVRQIGRGGMGVVYEANQLSLQRRVALKMLPPESPPDLVERFRHEALAAARLHHTNIVEVHGVGQTAQRHFYVMQYIEGRSLAEICSRRRRPATLHDGAIGSAERKIHPPRPPSETASSSSARAVEREWLRFVAQVGVQAGGALAYAHEQGVLHRDVKPSNILVDEQGVVRITDFGLAKIDGLGDLTLTGDVPGTLRYLAPERLRGQSDARSDVFSLGLVLYELLTGRPAYDSADRAELVKQVHDASPPTPRRLCPGVPRDLETIVAACLQPDPSSRYQSAHELADDCRRYLEDRPIAAQRSSAWAQLVRWSRRNRATAASLAAVGLLMAVIAAGSMLAAAHFRRQERMQRGLTEQNQKLASATRRQADQLRQNLYFAQMNLAAQAAAAESGFGEVARLLAPWAKSKPDLRGWEWHYLQSLCSAAQLTVTAHESGVNAVAFDPKGMRLVSGGWDGSVAISDAATGRRIRTLQNPPTSSQPVDGNRHGITSVVWSPDGKLVAAASWDSSIKLWNVETGKRTAALEGHEAGVVALAWHPQGALLASGGGERVIRIWNVSDGAEVEVLQASIEDVTALAWSPDGARLASASGDFQFKVVIWDPVGGKELLTLPARSLTRAVAWSPDGQRLATAGNDGAIEVWDAEEGRRMLSLDGHAGTITAVAFDADGRRLASSSAFAQTVKIWDAARGAELRTFGGHEGAVNAAAWSPDGERIVSASTDGTIRIWDADASEWPAAFCGHAASVNAMAWSPKGDRLASIGADGAMKLWDPDTLETVLSVDTGADVEWVVAWSPDGSRVASAGPYMKICIWNAASGRLERELQRRLQGGLRALAWSPARSLAASGFDVVITLWDAMAGREDGVLIGHTAGVDELAFSPDGRMLASVGWDRAIRLWDVDRRKLVRTMLGHRDVVRAVVWSPDGRRMATADHEGVIKIWSGDDGRELSTLSGHIGPIFSLAWSPRGDRLASCGFDGAVMIWDPIAAKPIVGFRQHAGPVHAVAWSPDGRRLASGGADRKVFVYDAQRPFER